MRRLQILVGDCRDILPTLAAGSVQCCVSSPPYWGLRDYGTAQWEGGDERCDHKELFGKVGAASTLRSDGRQHTGPYNGEKALLTPFPYRDVCGKCGARRIDSQLGLEAHPEEYIAKMVAVFREVGRVLRDDGTCWINLGDCYNSQPGQRKPEDKAGWKQSTNRGSNDIGSRNCPDLKPKDLCMMSARLAMALQADGWSRRSGSVGHKPNPMPESVTDRPTKAHEMIYLLAKQERYFYDAEAIREPNTLPLRNPGGYCPEKAVGPQNRNGHSQWDKSRTVGDAYNAAGRNKRTVWTIATQPYAEAHFATFPEEIPKLCILAGSKLGDVVLDPFAGSGTTGQVALELGRRAILIELNPAYIELAQDRTFVTPGFL